MNANFAKALPPRPSPCWRCRIVIVAVLAAIVASFAWLGLDLSALVSAESLGHMGRFVAEFFPPDLSPDFLARTAHGALQTLAVSALGTVLAVIAGAVLALPASGRAGWPAQQAARFVLN
ncbi:PhnE/PtxC family ABC transporter permease, partial [Pseudacidovorax intermedius]|uniref:PhnE/PtxC family ABC transporter permease n=1 Tax=Pseudacidovorax intermedius TaxID=433924 RepID=UPI0034DCD9F4